MRTNEAFLEARLEEKRQQGLLRTLSLPRPGDIDFSSNDYLGLARSAALQEAVDRAGAGLHLGATGSRLISGNSELAEALESELASFHQAPAALLFNSGYSANIGLLPAIAGRGDTFVADELVHASLIDGMRLSHAQRLRFRHNDLADLERKLQQATGEVFIVAESVYSMDGDVAPLAGMVALAQQYGAHIVLDEAHGIGVFGEEGEGLAQSLGLHHHIFARIYTFGKAPGCHGAAIAGSQALRSFLINASRAFIYTTALPPHALVAIREAYRAMKNAREARRQLHALIGYFGQRLGGMPHLSILKSPSAIQGVLVPGNEAVMAAAQRLQAQGMAAKAIRHPTVAAGQERIRICLHAFNTFDEIDRLASALGG